MNRHVVPPVLGCLAVGVAAAAAAPASWGLGAGQGLLLGGALYAGGLRRYLAHAASRAGGMRAWREGPVWRGAALRAAAFLVFAALQGVAYIEWLPATDLRWTFVVFSTWVTIETLLEPRSGEDAASAPSRRA
jgi:uncharacterized membrane protein YfcA